MFCGGEMTKIFFKSKNNCKLILIDLNDIEKKFKQHYKEKTTKFIAALKLNNRHFDQN